ncbi:MAG: ArsR family transcriptional regulator [Lachnospiraceae bacterium]|jgi:predicted transcriptional regulator|nr:ArsR family transcriptional regulator [Lachnospiraceae bacterium]
MSKYLTINLNDEEKICKVGKALSSPIRLEILKLLFEESLYIREIANKLNIPASSAAMHVNVLKEADLISFETQPGTRGGQKICHRNPDVLNITLVNPFENIHKTASLEMPVGAYSYIKASPTCGLYSTEGVIGEEDKIASFLMPEHYKAGIIWTSSGYVVYRFANILPPERKPISLIFTLEMCSEAANYQEDWKSDISFMINEVPVVTWRSMGDYGARRGRLNPTIWQDGLSQYGTLVTVEITMNGTYINKEKKSSVTIGDLKLERSDCIELWIGNREDAKYKGGFNIFGKGFGDYAQDIVMSLEYE